MDQKTYAIQVLDSSPDLVKVKFSFLDTPVEMNYEFFRANLEKGYFKILYPGEIISSPGFLNQQVKGIA